MPDETGTVSALASIGFYSYAVYLWHLPVRQWMPRAIEAATGSPPSYMVRVLAYIVGSVVVGMLLDRAVESPFLALRDRLLPSRSGIATRVQDPAAPPREPDAPSADSEPALDATTSAPVSRRT